MERGSALATVRDSSGFGRSVLGRARERLHSMMLRVTGEDFDERVRRLAAQRPADHFDPFGLDLEWAKYALMAMSVLHRFYFRVETHGIEHVPSGRVLLIANHSGQVPIDAAIIASTMFYNGDPPRAVRSMVEKWSQTLPVVSTFFARCGQVVGVPENAARLLESDEALLVFPEGVKGINKPFSQRYQLQEFGLGFMRLALETDAPIVPIALVGAEEQYINVGNLSNVARALGMPSFPIIPQMLVPGGALPLPTKYHIYFGEPLRVHGDPDDEDAVIGTKVELVRQTIQSMISRGLKERKHVFW
ncbi:MAG: acyltransferase family protein [Polyangiaceae bacterium]|nr:acyltransferase family protein [Polyangiaceae bacterium]